MPGWRNWADATVLKAVDRKVVRVQVPLPALDQIGGGGQHVIELDESIVGVWYMTTDRDQDFMLGLNSEGDHLRMRYRFRYYSPESSDPHDGKDKKNWFTAVVTLPRAEAIAKMEDCVNEFSLAAQRMFHSSPKIWSLIRGEAETLDDFLGRFRAAPFAHTKELSEEEAKALGLVGE